MCHFDDSDTKMAKPKSQRALGSDGRDRYDSFI